MTVDARALLQAMRRKLAHRAGEAAGQEARWILAHVVKAPAAEIILLDHVDADAARRAEAFVERRAAGEPLAYVLGVASFWDFELAVGPGVLIPRSDTETLVRKTLEEAPESQGLRIMDLGVGSAAILCALLRERPRAVGVGVDRSEAALTFARRNVSLLGLSGRASLVCGHWADALSGSFDLIVSNPPYIAGADYDALDPGVREHEPERALRSGRDGLDDHRAVAGATARLLRPGGRFHVEIGFDQAAAAIALYRGAGLHELEMTPDLAGRARVLSGRRLERV